MADLAQLEKAFIAADDAGNKEDAAAFAAEIKRLRGAGGVPAPVRQGGGAGGSWTAPASDADMRSQLMAKGPGEGTNYALQQDPRADKLQPSDASGQFTNMGARAGAPAAGQALGAMTGPLAPVAVPVLGALGGAAGELYAQYREGNGFRPGAIAGNTFMGAIPGAPLENAGARLLLREGMKQGGANLVAKAIETKVDSGRMPDSGEAMAAFGMGLGSAPASKYLGGTVNGDAARKINSAVVDKVVAEAHAAGLKVLPSKVNPSAINRSFDLLGGKAQTVEDAVARNEAIARSLALKDIGRPEIAPSLKAELQAARDAANVPYQKIEAIAEKAKADIEALKKSRFTADDKFDLEIQKADPATVKELARLTTNATADIKELRSWRNAEKVHWESYERNPSLETQEKAIQAGKNAREVEDRIATMTKAIGDPALYNELKAAQRIHAKTHEIENAFGVRDSIDMTKLTRSQKGGAPLDGNLKTMADFGREFGPLAGTTARQGYKEGGGFFREMLNTATEPVRNLMLSHTFQGKMAVPSYAPARPDMAANMAKFGAMAAGRQEEAPSQIPSFLRR